MSSSKSVIVVGSGVIGLSAALSLQKAGLSVRVIDRGSNVQSASEGNAGAFALADIVPLATPGIMKAAPKWLFDPLGPLSIPPSYLFAIAPWLIRFWRASWSDKFPSLMRAQADLMALSRSALDNLAKLDDFEHLLRREGQLRVYDNEKSFQNSLGYWKSCEEFGVSHHLLKSSDEIAEIQPGLCSRFKYAGYTPDWINVEDPKLWLKNLRDQFVGRGGVVHQRNVVSLNGNPESVEVKFEGGELRSDYVVVATGAWSNILAKTVGDDLPLETERGYNTTFEPGSFELRTHLTFADHGFVVSKVGNSLRVGGAVELGGLNAAPNFQRSKILLAKAKQFIPSMDSDMSEEWMGFRPSMPDSLPVIGSSVRQPRVIYAFGHGHLGLTQSAGTAELVRNTILGKPWPIPSDPFSPRRFSGGLFS